jgi:hypothetical protein
MGTDIDEYVTGAQMGIDNVARNPLKTIMQGLVTGQYTDAWISNLAGEYWHNEPRPTIRPPGRGLQHELSIDIRGPAWNYTRWRLHSHNLTMRILA